MTRGLVTSETIGVDCVPAACGEALAWAARRLRACVRELGAGLQGWAGQRGMSVLGLQCWGSTCVVRMPHAGYVCMPSRCRACGMWHVWHLARVLGFSERIRTDAKFSWMLLPSARSEFSSARSRSRRASASALRAFTVRTQLSTISGNFIL